MLAEEEQDLLAAHRAADAEDAVAVDPEPGQRLLGDVGHPGEVVDLLPVAPRVERDPASHPAGQMTAKPPCAGRSPHRFAFAFGLTPRPCGEITSGNGGGRCCGEYCAGTSTIAGRGSPLCAR